VWEALAIEERAIFAQKINRPLPMFLQLDPRKAEAITCGSVSSEIEARARIGMRVLCVANRRPVNCAAMRCFDDLHICAACKLANACAFG
jgi:hypothetical protein